MPHPTPYPPSTPQCPRHFVHLAPPILSLMCEHGVSIVPAYCFPPKPSNQVLNPGPAHADPFSIRDTPFVLVWYPAIANHPLTDQSFTHPPSTHSRTLATRPIQPAPPAATGPSISHLSLLVSDRIALPPRITVTFGTSRTACEPLGPFLSSSLGRHLRGCDGTLSSLWDSPLVVDSAVIVVCPVVGEIVW